VEGVDGGVAVHVGALVAGWGWEGCLGGAPPQGGGGLLMAREGPRGLGA